MNPNIEEKLWKAGQQEESYTTEVWYKIIDNLLDDFRDFIKQDFYRDPNIRLHLENPHSPSFGSSLWSKEKENSLLSTVWLGVIYGDMAGSEKDGIIEDIFQVGLTLFLFDAATKKRLCLTTGESIIEFIFEKSDERGCWRSLGWCEDEWGEWEGIGWE